MAVSILQQRSAQQSAGKLKSLYAVHSTLMLRVQIISLLFPCMLPERANKLQRVRRPLALLLHDCTERAALSMAMQC